MVMTPLLFVSTLLKLSVRDRSMTQHWIKSSNFIVFLSLRSNTRVQRSQNCIDLQVVQIKRQWDSYRHYISVKAKRSFSSQGREGCAVVVLHSHSVLTRQGYLTVTHIAYRLYPNDFSACCSSSPSILPDLSLSNLAQTHNRVRHYYTNKLTSPTPNYVQS